MVSKLLIIILLVLFSLSVTSISARDAFSKQEDDTYVIAANDQGSFMIDVAKARSLKVLVDGSKVVVSKAISKTGAIKSSSRGASAIGGLTGGIIAAIIVTVVIIWVLHCLYKRHKEKKAQNFVKMDASSETKADDHV